METSDSISIITSSSSSDSSSDSTPATISNSHLNSTPGEANESNERTAKPSEIFHAREPVFQNDSTDPNKKFTVIPDEMFLAGELIFGNNSFDPNKQSEIMSYYVYSVMNVLAWKVREIQDTLTALNHDWDIWEFTQGIDRALDMPNLMPLVYNSDGTLSLIRRPLVKIMRPCLKSFTEIRAYLRERDGSRTYMPSYFRPWGKPPDVVVSWWRVETGRVDAREMWTLSEQDLCKKLDELTENGLETEGPEETG